MASLAEIRAKLKEQETNTGGNRSSGGDNAIFPFWNMQEGSSATVRFLPDKDESNTFFWTERLMIKLPFSGIKGEPNSKPVQVQVPCMEMYGDSCAILQEVRGWFKDASLEDMGRKYWKKRSYLFQGFVRENPITDDKTPENPIRRFIISPQIFNLIKAALLDPELENLPTDYQGGLDFIITKTSKGGYADYSTSKWSRKESALEATEQAAIDSNGLHNLNDFLPKKPSEVELKVMKEMFEASVDGQSYDAERWGNYYRPRGVQIITTNAVAADTTTTPATPVAEAAPTPTPATPTPVAETPAPVAEAAPVETPAEPTAEVKTAAANGGQRAEDILKMIRSRQATQ